MTKDSSRSSPARASGRRDGYQEIPGNKVKLSWPFYVVWAILFVVIMWRVGSETRFPSESQLPAGTQINLALVAPDDGAALNALRRSSPPPDWPPQPAAGATGGPSWSAWVDAYYHGAGGMALFEPWGKQLQAARSRVRLLPTAVPRNVLTFEQLHRLITTGSRVTPDLAFVPSNVLQQLVAAGDLLPIASSSAPAPGPASELSLASPSASGAGSTAGSAASPAAYGVADVRQSELALLRLLNRVAGEVSDAAAPKSGASRPAPGNTAARLQLNGPEYLVILRTTRFPAAARQIVQQFQARAQQSEQERQKAWNLLVEQAQRAASAGSPPRRGQPLPIPRTNQLEDPRLIS